VAAETAVVGLSANNQNKIGPVQSVEHPPGPTFFWYPSDILIYLGIHAVRAESLGQAQHTLPMLGGVVTVTDKNFGRIRSHLALHTSLSDLAGFVRLELYP
jgi:hypothetical protein